MECALDLPKCDFSPATQWSAEFTHHILVTARFACKLDEVVLKNKTKQKYQVLYTVDHPTPKVKHTEPYHAVEKRHKTMLI